MLTKDTNPKDAVGIRKASMSCVPAQPLMELGLAMMEGARKYGRHNYRVAGIRASVYYDAALRHLMAWWEGEDIDPESGLSHLIKAMACLTVVRDGMLMGNWVDDRPPSLTSGWQTELNKKASDLIDRWPDAKDAYVNAKLETVDADTAGYSVGVHSKDKATDLGIGSYEVVSTSTGTTWKVENPDLWERYLDWCRSQALSKRQETDPEPALPLGDVSQSQPTPDHL
jgi:hypothetical protein